MLVVESRPTTNIMWVEDKPDRGVCLSPSKLMKLDIISTFTILGWVGMNMPTAQASWDIALLVWMLPNHALMLQKRPNWDGSVIKSNILLIYVLRVVTDHR